MPQPSHRLTVEDGIILGRSAIVEQVNVRNNTIRFTLGFQREFISRYRAGEPPIDIFRSHGVTPELIGRKRIERCTARWKRIAARPVNPITHPKENRQ